MPKTKIVVLSDIHIGTNTPTVWYQKTIHEPYLLTVFDWVIKNASSIREMILLGDVIDFWTYPPHEEPPSFDAIIAANPNIFGMNGKLSEILTALDGKVTYVRGNHDITITQEDLNKIANPKGHKIKLSSSDIYHPLVDNKKIICTHGHIYTILNAPFDGNSLIAPLPLGYFITRAVAFKRSQELAPGKTVAELNDSGDPSGLEIVPGLLTNLIKTITNIVLGSNTQQSIPGFVLDTIAQVTKMSERQPIILAGGTEITLKEAKNIYADLFSEWIEKRGRLEALQAIIADTTLGNTSMASFAEKLAMEGGEVVVMGHIHEPVPGVKDVGIKYTNSGFNCPSKPDIGKKHPTFALIEIENYQTKILQVVNDKGVYKIENSPIQPIDKDTTIKIEHNGILLTLNLNKTLRQISCITYENNFLIEVSNKTQYNLKYVGVENKLGEWTLRDIPANTNIKEGVKANATDNTFSFGANYQIEGISGFIQFAASWPLIQKRKINLGNIAQGGNEPAKRILEEMKDSNDKSFSNNFVEIRAFMKQADQKIIWYYEITENKSA